MILKGSNSVKKVIALSCWLIVGTMMLAHAVIPHHHHDGISCISYTPHDSSGQHHCDAQEDCLVTKVYIRWSKDKQIHQFHHFNFTPFPCQITLFSDDFIYRIKDNIGLRFDQKPYFLPVYTVCIARSSGLRAPPC